MYKLKRIGYLAIIIIALISLWFIASFIDIATKNHISDKEYKQYSDWNLIIIANNYCIERR